MKLAVYEEIRAAVIGGDDRAIQIVRAKHPTVSFDTVVSIHAQESSKRIRLNHHRLKSEGRVQEYMRRYASGEDILDLSQEYGMPPCLLARFLLEHLVGVPRGALGACLKNPACIPSAPVFFVEGKSATNKRATPGAKGQAAGWGAREGDVQAGAEVASRTALRRQTDAPDRATERVPPGADGGTADLIRGSQDEGAPQGGPDQAAPAGAGGADGKETTGGGVEVEVERIRGDVYRCVENDSVSSPAVEVIRRVAGLEYEALLYAKLRSLKIPFQSEEQLRAAGFSKTPDAKLDVPIAVKGRPVWWIDSKASFGDEYNHKTQVTEQFERYVNRFGPGLVIYWFGFIDDLNTHAEVLLMEGMPKAEDIVQLQALPIPVIELTSELETCEMFT